MRFHGLLVDLKGIEPSNLSDANRTLSRAERFYAQEID